jgi:hypothetical protein
MTIDPGSKDRALLPVASFDEKAPITSSSTDTKKL